VKANLCRRCLVQISYAIGVAKPLSVSVFSYGTSPLSERELLDVVDDNFDLRPGMIIKDLNLKRPIFEPTAENGHFGHSNFPWEQERKLKLSTKIADKMQRAAERAAALGPNSLDVPKQGGGMGK